MAQGLLTHAGAGFTLFDFTFDAVPLVGPAQREEWLTT